MNTKIKPCIALDVGNCCIRVSDKECLKRIGLESIADVPKEFLISCEKFECGKISLQEWLCEFRNITGGRFSDRELVDAWNSIICDEIEGMYEVLEQISSLGVKIAFLSDTSELHIKYAIRKMRLSVFVTGAVYSFEAGCRKPCPEIYKLFECRYGKPILYVDDKQINIDAARELGWNAHLFQTPQQFWEEFQRAYSLYKSQISKRETEFTLCQ